LWAKFIGRRIKWERLIGYVAPARKVKNYARGIIMKNRLKVVKGRILIKVGDNITTDGNGLKRVNER
jgi:aconitase A